MMQTLRALGVMPLTRIATRFNQGNHRIEVPLIVDRSQRALLLPVDIGGLTKFNMQIDTGCSSTQYDLKVAKSLKLRGHPRLYGTSRGINGQAKVDYLMSALINVGGVIVDDVAIKFRKNNAPLLGFDVMSRLDMIENIYNATVNISTKPDQAPTEFCIENNISFSSCMSALQLTDSDLICATKLPNVPPQLEEEASKVLAQGEWNVGTVHPVLGIYLGHNHHSGVLPSIFGISC